MLPITPLLDNAYNMKLLIRFLAGVVLLNTLIVAHAQDILPEATSGTKNGRLSGIRRTETKNIEYNNILVIEVWSRDKKSQSSQPLGLRYKPNDDQNVYLLCNYVAGNSRAEIGLSLNNFTAMTVTYGRRFSFKELIK